MANIIHLNTQAQFETMWFNVDEPDKAWIVYFTADWCNPCKKLDILAIADAATEAGIPFYKCDYVVNDYTSGYCAVNSFPTFQCMKPRKIVKTLKSSDTNTVLDWIKGM